MPTQKERTNSVRSFCLSACSAACLHRCHNYARSAESDWRYHPPDYGRPASCGCLVPRIQNFVNDFLRQMLRPKLRTEYRSMISRSKSIFVPPFFLCFYYISCGWFAGNRQKMPFLGKIVVVFRRFVYLATWKSLDLMLY